MERIRTIINYLKTNTIEKVIVATSILSYVILLLFDVYPGKETISQDIRVILYAILDFAIALFFLEGVTRFFLSWKRVEELTEVKKGYEKTFFDTLKSFFDSLDRVSYCDIATFAVVIYAFFNNHIELYGIRFITLLVKYFSFDDNRLFVKAVSFKDYFEKDGDKDPDHNKADDRNRFLRYLVYFNLAFFVLMALEHIRQGNSIVAVWFIATFFAAFSALFYVWDLVLRIKDKIPEPTENKDNKAQEGKLEEKNEETRWQKIKRVLKGFGIFIFGSGSKLNIADTILTAIALLSVFDILINLTSVILNSTAIGKIIVDSVFLTEASSEYSRFALIIRPFAQLRIFSTIPKMKEITRTIVNSFLKILPAFFYFAALFIIYAAVGHMLFKDAGDHFKSFGIAIRSLFRIMTFESWGNLMDNTIGSGKADEIVVNIYYYSFIIFVSYIMWSVVQGLIVSSVQATETQQAEADKNKNRQPVTKEQLLSKLDALNTQMEKIGKEIEEIKEAVRKEDEIIYPVYPVQKSHD